MHTSFRIIVLVAFSPPASAGVVTYECGTFPEEAGWDIVAFYCTPEVSIQNDHLVQAVQVGGCHPPPNGDQESLSRSLVDFDGSPTFFIEWRVETDGDRSEIPGTAPSLLSAWSLGPTNYHVTIARDRVRFIRDNLLPILYIDIAPGMAHTFRLEHYGAAEYRWYIDGQLIDSGVPEGPYPSFSPAINFRAKSWYLDSTTTWDYIRYGTIAVDYSGDFDSNGAVDLGDIYYFCDCLLAEPYDAAGPGCRWADMNADGKADGADIGLFTAAMLAY